LWGGLNVGPRRVERCGGLVLRCCGGDLIWKNVNMILNSGELGFSIWRTKVGSTRLKDCLNERDCFWVRVGEEVRGDLVYGIAGKGGRLFFRGPHSRFES